MSLEKGRRYGHGFASNSKHNCIFSDKNQSTHSQLNWSTEAVKVGTLVLFPDVAAARVCMRRGKSANTFVPHRLRLPVMLSRDTFCSYSLNLQIRESLNAVVQVNKTTFSFGAPVVLVVQWIPDNSSPLKSTFWITPALFLALLLTMAHWTQFPLFFFFEIETS